jgi:hypothetical protein
MRWRPGSPWFGDERLEGVARVRTNTALPLTRIVSAMLPRNVAVAVAGA